MRTLLMIASLVFSMQTLANPTATLVTEDSEKIAVLLKFYPAFSQQVFAEAAAFGFTPAVRSVSIDFTDFQEDPENVGCRIELTGKLGVGVMKHPAPEGVKDPFQAYEVVGPCSMAMEYPVFDI